MHPITRRTAACCLGNLQLTKLWRVVSVARSGVAKLSRVSVSS